LSFKLTIIKEVAMKKLWIIGLVAVFVISITITLTDAQQWKGSGGWGYKSQYQMMYNPQSISTIKGIPVSGMSYGIHLKVKTETETLSVHLGPAWFIERQDIEIKKDDTIEVKGSKIIFDEAPAIIAAEVKKGDTVLKLRDKNGLPVWAGTGMGRMRKR
jgi:hypothetical protein